MAKMIDIRPSLNGEAKLWDALESYLPNNVVVYNNREINGREFDFCLFLESTGIVIIEIKGWVSDKIEVKGVDNIIVEGHEKPQRSPKKQARAYRFALLNRIVEKYNTSPLVFDMVCYPFISKADYIRTHLDIVSEEQFTIFKEDLEKGEQLINKIQMAYFSSEKIPHAELTPELKLKLRQDWEPNISESNDLTNNTSQPYSILSVYPNEVSRKEAEQIAAEYFKGIKHIVFVGDVNSYEMIIDCLDADLRKRNIQASANKLSLGYKNGLHRGERSVRTFNIELYYVEKLNSITASNIVIEEGNFDADEALVLNKLAEATTFNLQQYQVEHSPTNKNTLVEAGAGTGKTFSMVSRIAFLCNKKIDAVSNLADDIAMVTFTNDAANNMKIRLKQMFVNYFILTSEPRFLKFIEDIDRSHISTIHSFALSILREEVLYTGLGTRFRIASNEYLRGQLYDAYLSAFLEEMEQKNPNFINEITVPIYDLKKRLLMVADRLLTKSIDLHQIKPSEMGITVDNTVPFFNELIEKVIIPSEKLYAESMHATNSIDLNECIIILDRVLKELPEKLDSLRLKYMFVDEFQDTDDVQIRVFQLLQKLINSECKMFVVGDLKQSIYRFRGARLSAFDQLIDVSLYEWSHYKLTKNYRTDYRLLDKLDTIFARMGSKNYLPYKHADDRLVSNVLNEIDDDSLLVCVPCHAKDEDALFEAFLAVIEKQKALLSNAIAKRSQDGREPLSKDERTIAVLVRSNWQVEKLVSAARKKGIVIDTKSVGDLFQLESTIDLYKLVLALKNSSNPLFLMNLIESNYTELSLDYQQYQSLDTDRIAIDLQRVLDEFFSIRMQMTWQQIVNSAYTLPILYVLKQLYDALQPWKQFSHHPSAQKHYMANYEYLFERIIKYTRLDTLTLNQLSEYLKVNILTRQQVLSRDLEQDNEEIRILCTTVHKSKGLEYGTVVLPYTDEEISDIRKVKTEANYSGSKLAYTVLFENKIRERNSNYDESIEVEEQIAEESRILYVALTRTIRNCVWIQNVDSNPAVSWSSFMEG